MTATNPNHEPAFQSNVAVLASNLTIENSGWTPPATIGGTWCRVSPDGVYETWPRDPTRCETVRSDDIKALLGTATMPSR